jgi:predicted nucleic acid-binding protein
LIRYFDASALVKRYVVEDHSETVQRLLSSSSVATSRLSEVEIVSALARRCREGVFSESERDRIFEHIPRDFETFHVIEIVPEITVLTYDLLRRHRLRASDSLQLASCLYLSAKLSRKVPLIGFDSRLTEAAEAEGLDVDF